VVPCTCCFGSARNKKKEGSTFFWKKKRKKRIRKIAPVFAEPTALLWLVGKQKAKVGGMHAAGTSTPYSLASISGAFSSNQKRELGQKSRGIHASPRLQRSLESCPCCRLPLFLFRRRDGVAARRLALDGAKGSTAWWWWRLPFFFSFLHSRLRTPEWWRPGVI
jgi:hypothetical protein